MFWSSLLTYKIFNNTVWVLFISHYPASDTFPCTWEVHPGLFSNQKKKYTQNIKADSKKSIWYIIYTTMCIFQYVIEIIEESLVSDMSQVLISINATDLEMFIPGNWTDVKVFFWSILWKALRIIITVINKQNIHSLKG